MVRKRGKSRTSDSTKRAARYELKYSVDPVTKRFKKLVPVMYPQMEAALVNWDFLEVLVFPKLEELEIPEDQIPFYMAWVKRKAEKGLMFAEATLLAEYQLLKAEFVERGLDPIKLDKVEPFVDSWVGYMRASPVVTLLEWVSVERNIAEPSHPTVLESVSIEKNVAEPSHPTVTESVSIQQNTISPTDTISESVEVTVV